MFERNGSVGDMLQQLRGQQTIAENLSQLNSELQQQVQSKELDAQKLQAALDNILLELRVFSKEQKLASERQQKSLLAAMQGANEPVIKTLEVLSSQVKRLTNTNATLLKEFGSVLKLAESAEDEYVESTEED